LDKSPLRGCYDTVPQGRLKVAQDVVLGRLG
jgi:hypothetical protein